jgi:hypothetical protein
VLYGLLVALAGGILAVVMSLVIGRPQ